jgi:hypothetical protein
MGQLSEVAIYNMALDMLDEAPVTAPSDDTRAARLLARNYAQTRDEVLRAHPWNFAMARALLAAGGPVPAFGWLRAFPLPVDCLRLLPVVAGGHLNGAPVAHEVEGGAVLTDAPAPLAVRYVRRVSTPSDFDPLFARALAARLAVYVGHVLTGKQSYVERIARIYTDVLVEARRIDALEATPPTPLGENWIEARY